VPIVKYVDDLIGGEISYLVVKSFAVEDRFAEHPYLLMIKMWEKYKILDVACKCFRGREQRTE